MMRRYGRIDTLMKQNAELHEQIAHQKVGAGEAQEAMQNQDRLIAKLQRENKLLRDGLAMNSPGELWPNS